MMDHEESYNYSSSVSEEEFYENEEKKEERNLDSA
jgi:hypothetical protein